jgi:cytochrome c
MFPVLFAAIFVLGFSSGAGAIDEEAARTLAKQSGCFMCHAVEKKKDGPAYRDIAAKYKVEQPPEGAQARLITHITTGEMAKLEDGHEEEHKIVKSNDQNEIKNLVDWILSLPGGAYTPK